MKMKNKIVLLREPTLAGGTYLGWGTSPSGVDKQTETITFPHPMDAGGKN